MAFKNAQKTLTTEEATVYTAPAATDAILISGILSNTDTSNKREVNVTMKLVQGSTTTFLLTDVVIPYGGSLTLPKIVIKAGGKINALAANGNSESKIDVTLGLLETPVEEEPA